MIIFLPCDMTQDAKTFMALSYSGVLFVASLLLIFAILSFLHSRKCCGLDCNAECETILRQEIKSMSCDAL